MPKRLLLADDHLLVLEGLSHLLSNASNDFEVVGTASNGRALLAEAERLKPDVIVLDIGMPEMNGIEATRRLADLVPQARIVIVTQQLDSAYVHAAFASGARAYVSKQSAAGELVTAINTALQNRYFVTPLVSSRAARAFDKRKNPAELFGKGLTPRQREVLQLVAEGKSTKEISAALNISAKTVEFHRNSIMDELGLRTIAELTRYAVHQGIVLEAPAR